MVKVSQWANVMADDRITKLSEYMYVDKNILRQIINAGVTIEKVDELRAILKLNTLPGYDISGVLDYYDDAVIAICLELVKTNWAMIADEVDAAELDSLGVGEIPEVPVPEDVSAEDVLEHGVVEREPSIKPIIKEEPTVRVKTWTRKGRTITSWGRKRGKPTMSRQEMFIFRRRDMKPRDLSTEFSTEFGISRTPKSIAAKKYRLKKIHTPKGIKK